MSKGMPKYVLKIVTNTKKNVLNVDIIMHLINTLQEIRYCMVVFQLRAAANFLEY